MNSRVITNRIDAENYIMELADAITAEHAMRIVDHLLGVMGFFYGDDWGRTFSFWSEERWLDLLDSTDPAINP